MIPIRIDGIKNGWILDGAIWRSAQPEQISYSLLAAAGCRAVMNLRPASETQDEERLVKASGMAYYDLGWDGFNCPSQEQIDKALSIIRTSSVSADGPTLVHCQHGKDRTGTLCACWRVSEYKWSWERSFGEGVSHGELEFWMAESVRQFAERLERKSKRKKK